MTGTLLRSLRFRWVAHLSIGCIVVLTLAAGLAFAQKPRKSKPRTAVVSSKSPRVPVSAVEPSIISSAEEPTSEAVAEDGAVRPSLKADRLAPEDTLRKLVVTLSGQVQRLNSRLNQLEGSQRALVDLDRLSRAEQRSENLHTQLDAVREKESAQKGRLEQLYYELKPDVLERSTAAFGTTRPEDLRDMRRQTLNAERARIEENLVQLATGRQRLELAVANADAFTERLRKRVEAEDDGADTDAEDGRRTRIPATAEIAAEVDATTPLRPATTDDEIANTIRANLLSAGIQGISVEVADGVATLTGDISVEKVSTAINAAQSAKIKLLHNRMTAR